MKDNTRALSDAVQVDLRRAGDRAQRVSRREGAQGRGAAGARPPQPRQRTAAGPCRAGRSRSRRRAGARQPRPRRTAGEGQVHQRLAARRTARDAHPRSEEHTSELQSLMRISYAVFCLKKKIKIANSRTEKLKITNEQERATVTRTANTITSQIS